MKKVFKLEDLDCPNCALKMEEAVAKIDGVESVNVSFISQKLIIDTIDEKFDSIMKEVIKKCKKIEPDCKIILN